MSTYYHWENHDLVLACKLQPKAANDEFVGEQGDQLKIRITAPPVDGKANQHLIKFVAKSFGVSKSSVSIQSGELSRSKVIRITGPNKIPAKLNIKTKI